MPGDYGSHADYMRWVKADADARNAELQAGIHRAFAGFIEVRPLEVINFSAMTALDLAAAIQAEPGILKPLMACCNVAGRAIERDLDIRGLDTYTPHLSEVQSAAIAGYLKPFLPLELSVSALSELDRHFFVDKEIRARKGRWELAVLAALNAHAGCAFRKRRFTVAGESFEIDAAFPPTGKIQVAIDIKRIEARRDIHKRSDEIVNKAARLKRRFPRAVFAAVIYYPFTTEHVNVRSRLESRYVDAVCFASQGEEQIHVAVGLLVDQLGLRA